MKTLFTKAIAQIHKMWSSKTPPKQVEQVGLTLNSYSQQHVLQYRMEEANLSHDQKVIADIGPVRLDSFDPREEVDKNVFFCPMNKLSIKEYLQAGDNGPIPSEVVLKGFNVHRDIKMGTYILKNVELHSNGVITVSATENTSIEEVAEHYS